LGLIDADETTARKSTWWPIISTLGGYSPAKTEFINHFLGVRLQTARHKFTTLQYTPQTNTATLPGSALDADHRLPFYQVSRDIELAVAGEGAKINAYLELVTVNSSVLKNRLIIDTPVLNPGGESVGTALLRKRVLAMSDLVLVFTDLFEASPELNKPVIDNIIEHQDSNKFIFVVDHSEINLDTQKKAEILASWQRRMAELGIHTGQFVVLSQDGDISVIEQRVNNINNDRSYRVLQSLELAIRTIDDVVMTEVESSLDTWKERCNATTLIILGFVVTLVIFAEIAVGILDLFFDPIIGPIAVAALIAVMTPLHLVISRVHAKFILKQLHARQKQLNLTEDLAGLFEKSLGFWRTVLPITEPVGRNKKTRKKISGLIEQTKNLVQALNDQFSRSQSFDYNRYDAQYTIDEE